LVDRTCLISERHRLEGSMTLKLPQIPSWAVLVNVWWKWRKLLRCC